ncbi:MAG: beta strand repeat-containing protein [Pseudomonadota bacterium]
MKRNPLYVAIRRNALMSAGALAVTAGGALTAVTIAQANTTIERTAGAGAYTTVSATANGYFEDDAQENNNNTLESIIQNGSVIQETDSGTTSDVTADTSGITIEAVADGNVLANTESLNPYTGDVLASQAVGQLNDTLTVDVLVQNSTVAQDLDDLTGGVLGLDDSRINAEARLNASSLRLEDLAAGDYTSSTGPADLAFDGTGGDSDVTTAASTTLSTVQVNEGITGGATSSASYPSESTGNSIRIDAEVDETAAVAGVTTFGDTLSLTNSDIDSGIIGNSADSAIALDATGSIDASSGVSSVQDNFSARLAALNTGSNIEVSLTEQDDGAVIASLTGTAQLTGSGIGSAAVGSSATTLNRIEASGTIDNSAGAGAGVDLGLDNTADVDAGFASLSAQRIDAASDVIAATIGSTIGVTADDVDGGTVTLADSVTASDAIANEAANEARLIANGDIGSTEASIAIGNLQSSGANVRGLNASSDISVTIGNGAVAGSLRNDGVVSVTDNDIEASGSGNDSDNLLVVDGASIELDPAAVAGTTLGGLSTNVTTGVTNAAGASLINVQSLTGGAGFVGDVRSDINNADIFASIDDPDTDALNGTVTLSRNDIDSQASGNEAVNRSFIDADGTLEAVSSVGNLQIVDGVDDQFVRAQVDGDIALSGNNDTSITGNFSVDDNSIEAGALSNESTNLLSMQANGALSGVDTSGAVLANNASISGLAVEAAANATLSNAQSAADTLAQPYEATSDLVVGSTLTAPSLIGVTSTVDNNNIDLSAQGNQATSTIDIDASSVTEGNAAGSTLAALVSGQSADVTTATGAGLVSTTLGEAGVDVLNGTTTASLSGNTIAASAQGNNATSRADLAATGEIASTDLQPGLAAVSAGTQNANGGVVLVNGQSAGTTSASLDAANVNQTDLGVTLDIIGDMAPSADIIGKLAGNQLSADARANVADNTVTLNASDGGSDVSDTTVALASGQSANAVDASVTNGQFAIDVDTAYNDSEGVVLSITGAPMDASGFTPREIEALALGNTAFNTVDVTGTSGITATTAANGTATADIGATESAEADHALANAQITRGGGADIDSSLTGSAATIDLSTAATQAFNATLTIADQTLLALSRANFADSEVSLASTDGIASTQALTNTQEINTDNLTATNTGVDIGIDVVAASIFGSTLSVTGNSAGASALGNIGFNRVGLGEADDSGNITERVGSIAGGSGNATANATSGNTAVAANALSSSQDLASTAVEAEVGGTVNIGDNAAPLDLSSSTVTASNNRFDGELVGNQVGNTVDLFATGDSSANAALTSDQSFGTAATNQATGTVSLDFDNITGSTLSATGNAVTATSRANSGDNLLRVDAASISGGTSALASGGGNTEAGLALANRQDVVAGSSVASTATGSVTAQSAGHTDDSTVVLDDNRVVASTLGNRAGNTINLAADSASTASSALGNDQLIDGQLSGSATGTVTLTVGDGVDLDFDLGSTASIQDNETLASVMGNQAGNAIQVEAASIGNGAGNNANTGIGGGVSTAGDTGQALASRQTFTLEGETSANADGTYQFIGASDLSEDGDGSTATISGNVVRSQVDINSAGDSGFTAEQQRQDIASSGNLIDLQATGAITDPAGLANTQTISAGTAPEITASTEAVFGMTLVDDIEDASVVSLTDNVAQALVRGNNALNEVSVDAGGEVAAGSSTGQASAQVGIVASDPTVGGFVSANRQTVEDTITTSSTVESDALVTVDGLDPGDGGVVTVDGNLAWSQTTLNRGINSMSLGSVADPASSVTSTGALLNEQDAGEGTVNTTTTANTGLTITGTGDTGNDAVSITDNRSIAVATSNQATNAISVNAASAIASPQTTAQPSSVTVNAGLSETQATGDFALTNRQDSANAMNTLVGSAGTAMDGTGITIGDNNDNTPLSVDRNTLWAETFANSATSSIALNGAGVGAAAGVASVQSNSGNLSSLVQNGGALGDGPSIDISVNGEIADSAVSMANNQIRATATANDAVNTLNATSMTGVTSASAAGGGTATTASAGGSSVSGAGLSVLNAQENTGDVVSGAYGNSISFSAGSYDNTNGGAVALNGNMIAANSTGNRAVNSASVDGLGRSTTPVGVANHQRNSGNTLSSTVSGASINASISGGGTGSMAISSRNNTIAATTQGNVSGNSVSTGNAISRASGRLNR